MKTGYKYFLAALIAQLVVVNQVFASEIAQSRVKGDPDIKWDSVFDDGNISDTPYNRCMLIRKVHPEGSKQSDIVKNRYELFSEYVSNLYAQSIKISAYLEEEAKIPPSAPDMSNKISLIENEVMLRLADISRRINIINAFEAGTAILTSLDNLERMSRTTYQQFKAVYKGEYDDYSDCEVLK